MTNCVSEQFFSCCFQCVYVNVNCGRISLQQIVLFFCVLLTLLYSTFEQIEFFHLFHNVKVNE